MLTRMGIHNFALIEEMHIEFHSGVTVITGETGAGKSILIDALSILLGERASSEYIRQDKDKFVIEGVFDLGDDEEALQALQDRNIFPEDGLLYLSRSFSQNGKGLLLANGQAIPIKMVREIAPYLADIHGQYSNQIFLHNESHAHFLDTYTQAGATAYANYVEAFKKYQVATKELSQMDTLSAERERELNMLNHQINEIEVAQLRIGEDKELAEEIQRMDNFEHLQSVTQSAYDSIADGRTPLLETLTVIRTEIKSLVRFDDTLQELSELIDSAYFQLEEGAHGLSAYADSISFDEEKYNYYRSRDSLLYELKKKYGNTIEEILAYANTAQTRLEKLESIQYEKATLIEQVQHLKEDLVSALYVLSEVRHSNNAAITTALYNCLRDLGMENAQLTFEIKDIDSTIPPNILGAEQLELMFSPNKGEGARPLAKIASGGELSRIALAFSSVFSENSHHTMIFDEIDVGISGDVAIKVAEKLKALAWGKQIFCITHMPQTAAIADHHLHLNKKEMDGRTISSITELNDDEHARNIATMISGKNISESAIRISEELIQRMKSK